MEKFCSNCGKELHEGADVCLNCGKVLNKNQSNVSANFIENDDDKKANVGFILGLISIVAWLIPLFGYPVTICGIVFSSKGLKSNLKKSFATAGLVLSIIFLVLTVFNSFIGMMIQMDYWY